MSEDFLDVVDIRAVFQQVRRKEWRSVCGVISL